MKALVAVKRVVDYNVKVRVKADGSDVDIGNVKMSMNPSMNRGGRSRPFEGSGQSERGGGGVDRRQKSRRYPAYCFGDGRDRAVHMKPKTASSRWLWRNC